MYKFNFKLLVIFLFSICLMQQVLAQSIRITDFRFAIQDHKIRVVFDATGVVDYHLKESPDKIIVTFKNAKLIGLLNKTWLYKTPITTVENKQLGQNLQVILNLKKPVKVEHFILSKPYRLVIGFPIDAAIVESNSQPLPNSVLPKSTVTVNKSAAAVLPTEANKNEPIDEMPANVVERPADEFSGSRDVIIVIDPGHGGRDPGAIGARGTYEKDVALAIAEELKNSINRAKGFRAILTRNSDYFIPLRERLGIAHRYKADMFIAIHADAYRYSDALGASVFALSQRGATSEAARWLADKENESELGHAIHHKNALLRSVLIDLAQTASISASLEIGEVILRELPRTTALHSPRVEQAGFVVLKSPDIPSLLVETGFISNPDEEARLRTSRYQRKIAICLASGITRYFLYRPPKGTYLAKMKYKASKNSV